MTKFLQLDSHLFCLHYMQVKSFIKFDLDGKIGDKISRRQEVYRNNLELELVMGKAEKAQIAMPPGNTPAFQRVMSVDVLRGIDMFWILGVDSLVYALNRMTQTPVSQFLARQLEHAEWEGFHFYDLIFPLFLFIVGVSLVFSLTQTERAGKSTVLKRIARRSVLLFLLGIFYSGGFSNAWPDIRLMGVLNRIALAYFFAALLFCFFKPRVLAAISVGLLAGYWALLTFMPIRNVQLTKSDLARQAEQAGDIKTALLLNENGNFSAIEDSPAWAGAKQIFYGTAKRVTGRFGRGYNVADHFDFQYLPGRKYDVFFDPEGLLSTLPSIVTCLFGVFAGLLLRSQFAAARRKVIYLICFGLAACALGWLWNLQMPVIKKIWTPSYTLVAGGYSAILLGIFYLIVDVWKARKWCQPFMWIGMNPITLYLASNMVGGFRKLSMRLVGGDVSAFLDGRIEKGFGDMAVSAVGLLLAFWLASFLYRRKIFVRL